MTSGAAQGEVSQYALQRTLQILSTSTKVGRTLNEKQIYVCACESAQGMYMYVDVQKFTYIHSLKRCDNEMHLQNVNIQLKKLF